MADSDETFAEKENLVAAAATPHAAHTFGTRGSSTTAGRPVVVATTGAVVRLGLPGIVRGPYRTPDALVVAATARVPALDDDELIAALAGRTTPTPA